MPSLRTIAITCSFAIVTPRAVTAAAGCTKDVDCKGDRICSDAGKCVSPAPEPSKPKPKPKTKPNARPVESGTPARNTKLDEDDDHRRELPTRPHAEDAPTKYGVVANLLGPNALVGIGFVTAPAWWYEGAVVVGYNAARATASDATSVGTVTSTASASELTFLGRARFRLMHGHHAPILDAGFGFTHYSFDASGVASNGYDTISYSRAGTPAFLFAGAGYGYASDGWFRLALVVGGIVHMSRLGGSSIDATYGFQPSDRDTLQRSLDDATDGVTSPRLYAELSVSALF